MHQPDPNILEPDPNNQGQMRGKDDRTPEQKEEFGGMLKNVNTLYLGCHVLMLVDSSSMSRFWPIIESWFGMQTLTPKGLVPSQTSERYTVVAILTAKDAGMNQANLERMVKDKTPDQIFTMCENPDIGLTNRKDKGPMLEKIQNINMSVINVYEFLTAAREELTRQRAAEQDAAKARKAAELEAERQAEFESNVAKLDGDIAALESDKSAAAAVCPVGRNSFTRGRCGRRLYACPGDEAADRRALQGTHEAPG